MSGEAEAVISEEEEAGTSKGGGAAGLMSRGVTAALT